jgi:hypothetical protein
MIVLPGSIQDNTADSNGNLPPAAGRGVAEIGKASGGSKGFGFMRVDGILAPRRR